MTTASATLESLLPSLRDRSAIVLQRSDAGETRSRSTLASRRATWVVSLVATAVIGGILAVAIAPAAGRLMAHAWVPASAGWMLALGAMAAIALTAGRQVWRLQAQIAALGRELAAARETERWHRTVVDEVVDGVLVASPEGRLVEVNQAACVLLGRNRDQISGQRLWDMLPADDRLIALRRGEAPNTHGGGLRRLLRPDGSGVLADVNWSTLPDGRVVYLAREWRGGR